MPSIGIAHQKGARVLLVPQGIYALQATANAASSVLILRELRHPSEFLALDHPRRVPWIIRANCITALGLCSGAHMLCTTHMQSAKGEGEAEGNLDRKVWGEGGGGGCHARAQALMRLSAALSWCCRPG